METDTFELKTEDLRVDTYEIDMVLLENQIKEDKLRSHNKFIKWLKRIFKGNN